MEEFLAKYVKTYASIWGWREPPDTIELAGKAVRAWREAILAASTGK